MGVGKNGPVKVSRVHSCPHACDADPEIQTAFNYTQSSLLPDCGIIMPFLCFIRQRQVPIAPSGILL